MIRELAEKSRKAGSVFARADQREVDAVVRGIAKYVFDNAEILAEMAVTETGMGVYADKVLKNKGKSMIIWNALKGRKSIGVLRHIDEENITEIAKPMGAVAAVTPCTNPIVTPMCNAMFALKGGNTVIVSPHPRAKGCAMFLDAAFRSVIKSLGIPEDIYQTVPEPTVGLTSELMAACDVVIATGGMAMVKAAYSSGKPSFGVGAGNVQCIFDRNIDFAAAVKKAVAGRIFDNGIICSGEQSIIAPADCYDEIIGLFIGNGAYYVDDPELVKSMGERLFHGGVIEKTAVGQSAARIAEIAGINVPEGTRLIIVKPKTYGSGSVWSREKMFPVMSAYGYGTWEEAADIAAANLSVEGIGHSVAIHSDSKANIEYAGLRLPVSRILVNQICSTQNGGAFINGLNPTTTLGCGSWGNNSISENLFYTHLLNVSRIAGVKPDWRQPEDCEIWGDES